MSPKQEDNPPFGREENLNPGAREAAARLHELEGLAPRSMLRFYDQPLALAAMLELVERGEAEPLPEAMRRMRSHPEFRSRKHPPQLHDWLRKRGFIGWLDDEPDAEPAAAQPETSTVTPPLSEHAAPEAEQRIFVEVRRQARDALTETEFATWIERAFLGAHDGQLYFVAYSGAARQWIAQRCWRRLSDWWAKGDPRRRPINLVSKLEFEALVQRQQGAA